MPKLIKRLPKSQKLLVEVDGISFFTTVAQVRVGVSASPSTSIACRNALEDLERSRAVAVGTTAWRLTGGVENGSIFPAVSIALWS